MASSEHFAYYIKERAHKIEEFLRDQPFEPTKQEFNKLKEYDQIKHVLKYSAAEAKKPANSTYNRYQNIIPYDYNRIKLRNPTGSRDYVNGSYITGAETEAKSSSSRKANAEKMDWSKFSNINFLSTQAPLPNTREHHWQAIYENDIDMVVMLTKLKEQSGTHGNPDQIKCAEYWPSMSEKGGEQQNMKCGPFEITLLEECKIRHGAIKRLLYLIDSRSRNPQDEKVVTHLQFVGWPDYGVPQEDNHIIHLVKEVRELIQMDRERSKKYNILVHCSAGVGRTGTFMAIYQLMDKIEELMHQRKENAMERAGATASRKETKKDKNNEINIFETVFYLRKKRMQMVQSWSQYQYLYASVASYAREISRIYGIVDDYLSLKQQNSSDF